MALRYRNDAIPSKSAAPFYAAYFAVLGVVLPLLGPYLQDRGGVAGSALAGPLYARVGGSGAFLAAAVLSCALFVAWLPLARRLPGQCDGDARSAS